jgi:formylglycine-generating enzyme required for sulfatase activity
MKTILFLLTLVCCLNISAQTDQKSKQKKAKKKQATGWDYNGEFEKWSTIEQETPKGCVLVEGGLFLMGNQPNGYLINQSDSLFCKHDYKARVTIASFFISDHEVTNEEYNSFLNWFKIRRAMDILAEHHAELRLENGQYNEEIPIDWSHPTLLKYFYLPTKNANGEYQIDPKQILYALPDASCFKKEYDYRSNASSADFLLWKNIDSMSRYFTDPIYKDFPVVGISWVQANEYCKWLSNESNQKILLTKKLLKKYSYYFTTDNYLKSNDKSSATNFLQPNFRIPTEAEWEYAAVYFDKATEPESFGSNSKHFYPWRTNELIDKKGIYLANFGRIYDQNKLLMKKLNDDGFLFTAPIKSYAPNQNKIYEMAGNVSEWVMDSRENGENIGVYSSLMLENPNLAFKFAYNQLKTKFLDLDTNYQSGIDKVNEYLSERISYENHLKNNSPARVVKGGSWTDASIYLMPGSSTFFNQNSSSARIGFRVAMDRIGSPVSNRKRRRHK